MVGIQKRYLDEVQEQPMEEVLSFMSLSKGKVALNGRRAKHDSVLGAITAPKMGIRGVRLCPPPDKPSILHHFHLHVQFHVILKAWHGHLALIKSMLVVPSNCNATRFCVCVQIFHFGSWFNFMMVSVYTFWPDSNPSKELA